jgi:hypothetical protein
VSLLERVVRAMREADVRFALIGAGALAVHGVSRSTLDIDLFSVDQRCLSEKPWAELRSSGAEVEVRLGDAEDPLAGVVRCAAAEERPVDLVVGRFEWQRRIVESAGRGSYAGVDLPVVTPVGLVLLKLYAGGFSDVQDVRLLLDSCVARPGLVAAVEHELSAVPESAAGLWRTIVASD